MISRAEKMRVMRAQGMSIAQIMEVCCCTRSQVRYAVDDGYRAMQLRSQANRRRRRKEARLLAAAPVESRPVRAAVPIAGSPASDGGWVEDRTVWRAGPSRRFGYKCATKTKQEPKPERKRSAPLGILAATDSYLRGDGEALRSYLRRVGRESLRVVRSDEGN